MKFPRQNLIEKCERHTNPFIQYFTHLLLKNILLRRKQLFSMFV